MNNIELRCGDVLEVLAGEPDESYTACFCDPPYGLEFMGKGWDKLWRNKSEADQEWISREGNTINARRRNAPDYGRQPQQMQEWHYRWACEVLRVLAPGGVLLAFSGTRTWHRLAVAIEDAGFELYDTLMWVHAQGFPKGHRLDAALGRELGLDAVCQCDASMHSNTSTCHEPRMDGHSDKAGPCADGVRSQSGVQHCLSRDADYPDGCRQDRRSDGEQPHPTQEDGQAPLPLQECAPEHSRSGEREDDRGDGSGCTLCQAQRSDRLSSRDCSLQESASGGRLESIPESSRDAGACESGRHTPDSCQGLSSVTSEPEYSTGLPRCQICGKPIAQTWTGWNVALKPAWEPCLLARKPRRGTYAQTAAEHGSGALWVDGCRIGTNGGTTRSEQAPYPKRLDGKEDRSGSWARTGHGIEPISAGRWPANLLLDEAAAQALDEMSGQEASRFFYTAKASRRERDAGLEGMRCSHPTVKPLALCRYLATLIRPPEAYLDDAKLLVPFCGSGSEVIGAFQAGWRNILGIELEAEYVEIAKRRITHWTTESK